METKIDWVIVIDLILFVVGAISLTFGLGADKSITLFGFSLIIISFAILLIDYLIRTLWKK